MPRRPLTFAVTSGVLALAVLNGVPALATVDGMPTGSWDATCAGAATWCVESATITPDGGNVQPLSDLGLTASATTVASNDWPSSLRWSVDGWADQPPDVTAGEVSLVIRTGAYVPRVTTATAGTVRATRTGDDQSGYVVTVTGKATQVDWTTDPVLAAQCADAITCGDFNSTADAAGTGVRFEGLSLDLDGYSPDDIAALDGTTVASDSQTYQRVFTSNTFGDHPFLMIGSFGNPQLDVSGLPVRTSASVWLPPAYLAAVQAGAGAAAQVTAISAIGNDLLTPELSAEDGGTLLRFPKIGFGSTLGMLMIRLQTDGVVPGTDAPGVPEQVRAMADVSGGARISWFPPLDDHGSAVTAYRARAYLNSTTLIGSCTSATLSCNLTGLTAGQNYYVRVSAVSALGEGPAAMRAIDRPTAPSAPRTPKVAAGPGRLTLSWTEPLSTGGQPITGYTVRAYRLATGGTAFSTCLAPTTRLTCTVGGLTAGARIYLSVRATNMAGSSAETARVYGNGWTVASAPRLPKATSARSRVTVSWTAPAATGGTPVTGYRADLWTALRGGGVAARCTSKATVRTCVTPVLTPGRTYYASVTALNAVGASAQPARVKVVVKR
ncbi:fibronectin type III domain-containing protein [Actinoplanes sp. NBRC 103695]|uniref:fibronectin type III domain-containing protein n=1 Tax=Actinoplanes sp. NBRC 103695 TaxID=3032202 RepID=UPI0024A478EE|nr:fibronectin type III domain-containing protein [Actinoplanes sp. NBRC 103695]GLY98699.1 hypothetical protein Acsp02_59530 [Actinoplanes sp. NBRC 103695]